MQDEKIVELFWQRDEAALRETQNKYDSYLTKIAYNILFDREDCKESVMYPAVMPRSIRWICTC